MGKGFEQAFLQKRYTNGQIEHEMIINVISHNEIPFYMY
jgi:hypothetical protein